MIFLFHNKTPQPLRLRGLIPVNELVHYVRHQGNVTCSLDSNGQCSLMLCASTGNTTRKDLTSLRYILLQLSCILVIDYAVLITAEYTNFFSSANRSSLCWSTVSIAFIISHDKTS